MKEGLKGFTMRLSIKLAFALSLSLLAFNAGAAMNCADINDPCNKGDPNTTEYGSNFCPNCFQGSLNPGSIMTPNGSGLPALKPPGSDQDTNQ